MKAYFDITAPLFIVTEPSFDAYPVELSAKTLKKITELNELIARIRLTSDIGGAPEDTAATLAQMLEAGLKEILK